MKDLTSLLPPAGEPDDDNAFPQGDQRAAPGNRLATLGLGNYATQRKIRCTPPATRWAWPSTSTAVSTNACNASSAGWTVSADSARRTDRQLRSMVMDIDYENWLRQNASSDKVAEFRMSNVWFLIEALKNTLERDEEGDMTIEQAIAVGPARYAGAPQKKRKAPKACR